MASFLSSFRLPTRRPFSWRALWILVALQLLGNLLSIPTLAATNQPIDPLPAWILWTALSIPVIALSLWLGSKIGLGAPLLEGYLTGHERNRWAISVVTVSVLVVALSTPLILIVNRNINPQGYPAIWKLFLASVDAGVQEEIFMRLILMTGLAWLGGFIWKDADGRPTNNLFWTAIIITGLIFGWGHVDDKLSIPGVPISEYLILMLVGTLYGIVLGWLYWKLGLECAILAHFTMDVMASVVVVPVVISQNLTWQLIALIGISFAGILSWIGLKRITVE